MIKADDLKVKRSKDNLYKEVLKHCETYIDNEILTNSRNIFYTHVPIYTVALQKFIVSAINNHKLPEGCFIEDLTEYNLIEVIEPLLEEYKNNGFNIIFHNETQSIEISWK